MQPNDPAQPAPPYGQPGQPAPQPAPPPPGGLPGATGAPGQQPMPGSPVAPGATGPVPPQQPQGFDPVLPQPSGAPFARLPGPGSAPERRILIGDALTAFGGLLVFAFSFAPFVGYNDEEVQHSLIQENLPTWFSAWATETFMAPLTWFVVLGGLISISLAAARMAVPRDREVAGFRTGHLQIGVTLFVAVVLFGYAVSSKSGIFGHDLRISMSGETGLDKLGISFGWGGYLMLFGALAAAVGAVLSHLEIGPTVYPQPPRPAAPAPAGYPQQQPGYPAAGGEMPTATYPTVPAPGQPVPQQPPAPHQPAPPAQPMPQPPAPPAGQAWPQQ